MAYTNDRPSIALSDVNTQALFLHKSIDWEYENEWRFLRYLIDADNTLKLKGQEISLFKVPPKCFNRVILGCRMDGGAKKDLIDLVGSDASLEHIKIFQASLDPAKYRLRFVEVEVRDN